VDAYKPAGEKPIEEKDGNVFTDPLIASFEGGKIQLDPASPALKRGFPPIDVSNAGPRPGAAD
jgi:hypothetical protein